MGVLTQERGNILGVVGDSESPLISQPPYPHLSAWTLATKTSYPCPGNFCSLHFPGLGLTLQGGEKI